MTGNNALSETNLIEKFAEQLQQCLPPKWSMTLEREVKVSSMRLDTVLEFTAPYKATAKVAVEAKSVLFPGDVPNVVNSIKEKTGLPVLLITPYLSPAVQERIRDCGASYTDLTGNMRILLDRPGLYIEKQGATRNPWPDGRSMISLRGVGAGEVVRALCDFSPPYGVRELAERANLQPGTVSKVIETLNTEGLLTKSRRGAIEENDPIGIVRRWAQEYEFLKANPIRVCMEPRGLLALLSRLRKFDGNYAVTGSLAASLYAPIVEPRLGILYVEDLISAHKQLGLRPVDTGGNVILVEAKSPVVFKRTWRKDGIEYVALSQVAVDLMNSPGRGPNEAEALLEWMKEHQDVWRR